MRGYEKAKKKIKLDLFNELYVDLCESNINFNSNLEEFLNKTNINLKYSLRQSVIAKLLNCNKHSLQKLFFKAYQDDMPIVYSLPFEYIIKIEKRGFKVNHFACLTLWKILILIEFLKELKKHLVIY